MLISELFLKMCKLTFIMKSAVNQQQSVTSTCCGCGRTVVSCGQSLTKDHMKALLLPRGQKVPQEVRVH